MNAFVIMSLFMILASAPSASDKTIASWPNDFSRILTVSEIVNSYQEFVGKDVVVRGFLTTTHTAFQLWNSKEDFETHNYENCLDVSMNEALYNKRGTYHRKYVLVSGPIIVTDIPFVDTGAAGGVLIPINSEERILIDKYQGPHPVRSIKGREQRGR